jgi:hypothetical protein
LRLKPRKESLHDAASLVSAQAPSVLRLSRGADRVAILCAISTERVASPVDAQRIAENARRGDTIWQDSGVSVWRPANNC